MKKTSLLLCVAMLLSLFAFTSCAKIENAEQLMERVTEEMSKLDWYELELDMDMKFFMLDNQFDAKATGQIIQTGAENEQYFYYEGTTVTVKCESLDIDQTVETVTAYQDGQMFLLNTEDGEGQKLRSPISQADFEAYKEEQEDSTDLSATLKNCANTEFTKNEDKSWTLKCSGFSKEDVDQIFSSSFDVKDMIGAELEDVLLTLEFDKTFIMTTGKMEFVFKTPENAEQVPEMKATFECKNVNQEPQSDLIKVDDYREVTDARLFTKIEELMEDAYAAESATFTLETYQSATMGMESSKATETDTVKYITDDNGYRYYITALTDGKKYELVYENGYRTVNGTNRTAQTEAEAKSFIQSLINSAGYEKERVTDVQKDGNAYTVTIADPDLSKYGLESYGSNSSLKELKIIYTVGDDGKPITIESRLELAGDYTVGGKTFGFSFLIKTSITYTEEVAD